MKSNILWGIELGISANFNLHLKITLMFCHFFYIINTLLF